MNREQKQAWMVVILFGLGLVVSALLSILVTPRIFPAGFSVLGLAGLGPLIFRKKRSGDNVVEDERDRMISHKAMLAGAAMSYLVFVGTCMATWFVYMFKGRETIGIQVLPLVVLAGFVAFIMTRSVTLLLLYGREGGDGEE